MASAAQSLVGLAWTLTSSRPFPHGQESFRFSIFEVKILNFRILTPASFREDAVELLARAPSLGRPPNLGRTF